MYSNVYLDEAIQSINARAAQDNIKFVFITGDMTDSAEPLEFMTARKQLLNLTIPWFPMLGVCEKKDMIHSIYLYV